MAEKQEENKPGQTVTVESQNKKQPDKIGLYVYESTERKNEETIISEHLKKNNCEENYDFKFQDKFNDIAFRILLLDDKIGHAATDNKYKDISEEGLKIEIEKCIGSCINCSDAGKCKLGAIKFLMDKDSVCNDEALNDKIGKLKNYLYWKNTEIDTYYCPTILKDFISDETSSLNIKNIEYSFEPETESDQKPETKSDQNKPLHVQIIGVRDVRTALLLMSKYKFDIIFCDYLLDKKDANSEEHEFSIQLFEFLMKKHQNNKLLNQLCRDVLDNRGPLGKYWIMPITEFNEEFIKALEDHHINLIDYRWNINKSADPITTPKEFLYHLNRFIELQLRSCVFTMDKLLTFLLYTCQDLKTLGTPKGKSTAKVKFDDFQSFMGSEYATLMQRYGNRLPIKRDARIGSANSNKSVFATYIWNKFYADKNFVNELELYRLMHRFYHQVAVMYNDRNGCQRLNEAFEHLCFFIYTSRKVQKALDENSELQELVGYMKPQGNQEQTENKGLPYLKEVIEKYTRYGIEELINNK